MPDTLIENPILNSPFREPNRHFRFSEEGGSHDRDGPQAMGPSRGESRGLRALGFRGSRRSV